jgi:hypothetical protein
MPFRERETVLAHEFDAAWIIALWKFIHGGDPAPEAVAAEAIAALAQYLQVSQPSFNFEQLRKQFAGLGIGVTEHTALAASKAGAGNGARVELFEEGNEEDNHEYRPPQYCFDFEGEIICIERPRLVARVELP